MNRVALIQDALERSRRLLEREHPFPPFESLVRQLEYLQDLTKGKLVDRKRLEDITIGQIAFREVEPLDEDLASLLHQVSSEVERMKFEG